MVVISFITTLFVAVQDPIIQKFSIRIAGGYISSKTGAEIRIGRLYISPNFTIHIDHFTVKDLRKNNLLHVEELRVRPIMEDIIHGKIHVGSVELRDAEANLITYEGENEMNFQFLLDAFASSDTTESESNTEVYVDHILLKNLDFQLWDQNNDEPESTEQHLMDFNHLSLDSICLDLKDLVILNDSITGRLNHLSTHEVSGFRLDNLSTLINVSPSGVILDSLRMKTANSDLHLDLRLALNGYQTLSHFVDSVNLNAKIYPSDLMVSDFGPFSGTLYEMPDLLHLEGLMTGPVSNFRIDGLQLSFGNHTRFAGDIALQPLNLENRVQVLQIKKLDYDCDDLSNFYLPIPSQTIPMPSALAALDHGTISGQFNGSLSKFRTSLNVTSEIGNVNILLDKRLNEKHEDVYDGELNANRLDVGALANASDIIGTLDLQAHVTGRQTKSGDFDLTIDGSVLDAQLLGTLIDEIKLDGALQKECFNGKIHIDDNDLGLDFNGSFDFSDPKALGGNFKADIAHADLYRLHLLTDDEVAILKASITANMNHLNDFNQAEGTLSISDLSFNNSNGEFVMKQFDGNIVNDNLFQKRINANCDFFDFKMAGKMDFTTLGTVFKQYINSYVEVPQWSAELERFEKREKPSEQDFIVELNLKNPKPLTKLLMPSLTIAKNTTLNGTFTSKSKSLNLTLRSNYVKINSVKINDIECKSISSSRLLVTRLNMGHIILRDSTSTDSTRLGLDNFKTSVFLVDDSIKANIVWDDDDPKNHNKADINSSFVPTATGGRFNIAQANIILNDSTWTVSPGNSVEIDDSKIRISNMAFTSHHQRLAIDGYVPTHRDDTLTVMLDQFNVSTFDFLTRGMGLDPDGFISGEASVSSLNDNPSIFANLGINALGINGQTYGDAIVFSQWNNQESAIELNMELVDQEQEVVRLNGSYYTQKADDNLDFTLTTEGLNIGILSPFLKGTVHRLQGLCTGHVDVTGSIDQPVVEGDLTINDGGCMVDYLNTYYTFNPTITLTDGVINLNKFSLVDTLGHSAMVAGTIKHDHLKDFVLDIRLYPNNFLAMATTAELSPSFYGTAIANGVVKATGPIDDLTLDIKAMTQKGTVVTIPLDGSSSVKQHEFITFVEHTVAPVDEEDEEVVETVQKKSSSSLNIKLELNVNEDAQVKITLPGGLGSMEAKGSGTIKVGLPEDGPMTLIGDYVINDGSLALNIQNLLKRNFALEPGSSISWTGDAERGTIDATGVYQTKASLSSLGLVDSTSMSSSNVRVDCMVHLKNSLLSPDITFGLRLPKASEDLQQAVFNIIDTTNQSEVLVQAVYLMLFNTFNYGGTSTGYTGFISNQLNDIISQFTNDIDINVNYRPGSEMSNEEMTVALKKQLFDDRLTIETNFGVVIPNSTYASNSTNIVGDFNIDYKITKDGRLSGQVFNRSNYNTNYYQYTYYKMAPYTQGIGISYSKSFDTFGDLFKKRTNTLNLPNRPVIERPGSPLPKKENDGNGK